MDSRVDLLVKGFLRGMLEAAKANEPYVITEPLSDEAYRALAIIELNDLAWWASADGAQLVPTRRGIELVER